jgi:protein SCO1/2
MKYLVLFLCLVLAGTIFFLKDNYVGQSSYVERFQSRVAPEFSLQSAKGEFNLEDFKGKTLVLYFGFTYCPDVCPTSISFIQRVFEKIKSDDLRFIFVSVDHKRDTPKSVTDYVQYYNKEFIGATGTQDEINEVTKKYNIFYRFINLPKSHMKYTVDHTSRFIVIDKNQQWVDSIHSESTLENTIERIKKHL